MTDNPRNFVRILTDEQLKAIHALAASEGWDQCEDRELRLLLWALFHYYTERLEK